MPTRFRDQAHWETVEAERKRWERPPGKPSQSTNVWGSAYSIPLLVGVPTRRGVGASWDKMPDRFRRLAGHVPVTTRANPPVSQSLVLGRAGSRGTVVRRKDLSGCTSAQHQQNQEGTLRLWVILRFFPNRNTQVSGSCRQTVPYGRVRTSLSGGVR